LAIAIVGLLESGSIARTLAMRADVPLDANREFLGQGLSNIAGSFFTCYPSSASFTRSGLNYDSGARTPLAAVFAALFLVVILLVAGPLMALVPLSAISGLILLIGLRLIDVAHIGRIFRSSRAEGFILVTTFVFAAFIDLEVAVYVGVTLSLFVFVYKTSRPFVSIGAPDPASDSRFFRPVSSSHLPECPQLVMARIEGPIYFGSVEAVRRELRRIEEERPGQGHMILVILGVGEIDLWGAELLKEEAQRRKRRGGSLGLQTKTPKVIDILTRFHVPAELSTGKCHPSKGAAIAETVAILDPDICLSCTARIFRECSGRPGPSKIAGA
jgi:SulP family sulfate permease